MSAVRLTAALLSEKLPPRNSPLTNSKRFGQALIWPWTSDDQVSFLFAHTQGGSRITPQPESAPLRLKKLIKKLDYYVLVVLAAMFRMKSRTIVHNPNAWIHHRHQNSHCKLIKHHTSSHTACYPNTAYSPDDSFSTSISSSWLSEVTHHLSPSHFNFQGLYSFIHFSWTDWCGIIWNNYSQDNTKDPPSLM